MSTTSSIQGYPLSTEQHLQWTLHPAGCPHAVQATVHIGGIPDLDALSRALGALVGRHEILRTHLWQPPALKLPLQAVAERRAEPLALERLDLSGTGEPEQTARLSEISREAEQTALRPVVGAQLNAVAVRLSPERTDLILTLPPFCADAISFKHLTRQLAGLYAAEEHHRGTAEQKQGEEKRDEDVVQYADYAAWQEEQLSTDATTNARAYWVNLADTSMTTIPVQSTAARGETLAQPAVEVLTPAQAQALRALGGQVGADLRAVLLAAWTTWIWRVTRESPIMIASLVNGRERDADLSEAIGPFMRWLPIAVELAAEDTFATVIGKVSVADSRARKLQDGFTAEPLPENSAQSVTFELIDTDLTVPAGNVSMTLGETRESPLTSALSLRCVSSDDELVLEVTQGGGSADLGMATQAVAQLVALLDGVLPNAGTSIARLALSTSETTVPAPGPADPEAAEARSIPHAFAEQARRTPDRLALIHDGETLTYSQLEERANRLANVLCARGVTPGTLVGICVERGLDMVTAVLGVLKASAAYVPLDPSTLNPGRPGYPPERLAFMLQDSRVPILVAHQRLAENLSELPCEVLAMDEPGLLAHASSHQPPLASTPASVAYAIYTSGSTGRPKAVSIEHRAALSLWAALRRDVYGAVIPDAGSPEPVTREAGTPEPSASDAGTSTHLHISLNAPLGFDPSVQQLLALLDGHTLVIVPEEIRADGRALLDLVDRHAVDVWDCTPPQLRLLLRAGLSAPERQRPRLVLCGGEAIDHDTWTTVATAGRPRVFNLYGPTECTVDSTFAPIQGDRPTIGHPLRGVRTYVLDEDARPVPVGIAGELYIGGAGVAREYLNRPELTAERFIPDPFGPDGSYMYRTGDLARQAADGSLEFLGRLDDQVKLRSHRIELGEVTHALSRCTGVAEGIVTVRGSKTDEPRLVAYYVAAAGAMSTTSDLRAELKRWLPEYMLPSAFVAVEHLPLTPNGKVDLGALPAPTHVRPTLNVEFLAPRDAEEIRVTEIWGEVLDLDAQEIGVLDDFFDDLGGDSLRAVDLVNCLEALMRRELPLDFVVQVPTVREQAARLHEESPVLS